MASPALPVPIPFDSRIHWPGDSWIGPGQASPGGEGLTAGLGAAMRWRLSTAENKYRTGNVPQHAHRGQTTSSASRFIITINGISGSGASDIDTNFAARVAAYTPSHLFWPVSQNDRGAGSPGNFASQWQVYGDSIAAKLAAQLPACKVVMLALTFDGGNGGTGEQWTSTGWPTDNSVAVACDNLNAQVKAWAATKGYYWIDVRGTVPSDADTAINWESTHNTPERGAVSGPTLLTQDGGHPNFVTGQLVLMDFILKRCSFPFAVP